MRHRWRQLFTVQSTPSRVRCPDCGKKFSENTVRWVIHGDRRPACCRRCCTKREKELPVPIEVEVRQDRKRGCGMRKPGGLYLVGPPTGSPCGRLPLALETCPCCSMGIKPSRSWTWISPRLMFKNSPPCSYVPTATGSAGKSIALLQHSTCPASEFNMPERAGLLWVGGKFYNTPESFMYEAADMGISRRIPALPKDFVPGKTWVFLAHRDCIKDGVDEEGQPKFKRGVFSIFQPTAIEYVVKGDETEEKLERLVKRGITPVRVQPVVEASEIEL